MVTQTRPKSAARPAVQYPRYSFAGVSTIAKRCPTTIAVNPSKKLITASVRRSGMTCQNFRAIATAAHQEFTRQYKDLKLQNGPKLRACGEQVLQNPVPLPCQTKSALATIRDATERLAESGFYSIPYVIVELEEEQSF
ncbi:hypothetical protein PHISCL_01189 [Aspergillus sclerotialis]|uniref:Uncharacterized protein n=1 Tax=Aspergillus sclerotialis TaxID=2070753 RepID=A0A3A2ZTJ6_9EURO|nr:hypothetical protein PHISCL_01189 [Aspergillus sclerotialis]